MEQKASQSAAAQAGGLADKQKQVSGVPAVIEAVGEVELDNLRGMLDVLRAKLPSGVIVLGSSHEGKACFVCSVSDDLIKRGLHAGKLIGQVAKVAGGGGGGQPGKAQAGGKDASKLGEAIQKTPDFIASMVK